MLSELLFETGLEVWFEKGTEQRALMVVKPTINFSGVTDASFKGVSVACTLL